MALSIRLQLKYNHEVASKLVPSDKKGKPVFLLHHIHCGLERVKIKIVSQNFKYFRCQLESRISHIGNATGMATVKMCSAKVKGYKSTL